MKNIKRVFALIVLVALAKYVLGCHVNVKTGELKPEIVVDEIIFHLPTKSNIMFDKALIAMVEKEYEVAGKHLETGIKELTEEATINDPKFRKNLNVVIMHLTGVLIKLKRGEKVDADVLRNILAKAETNVTHQRLKLNDNYI